MRRTVLAVALGVLTQAALLTAVSAMPPHHPATATTAFRLLVVGAFGGFVAGALAPRSPAKVGALAGAVTGLGVAAGFWWLIFHGETVGVFHHLHYVVATTIALVKLAEYSPHLVVAIVDLAIVVALAVGGYVGGRSAAEWPQ